MAQIDVQDGYPAKRMVDGTNVKKRAEETSARDSFGKTRQYTPYSDGDRCPPSRYDERSDDED